jgi:predicted DNA-binding transcriptional regulator YafY
VSRIATVEVTEESFEEPAGFVLAEFWAGRKEEFHMTRQGYRVRVRARGRATRALLGGQVWDAVVEGAEDAQGWTTIALSVETKWAALDRMLGLGAGVDVLEPEELRMLVVDAVRKMNELYANEGDAAMPAQDDNPSGS